MNLHWFLSRTVRHASQMRKHVGKILSAQRDLLSPPAIDAVSAAMNDTQKAIDARADKETLLEQMTNLEKVANKWLKPYPSAGLRENIDCRGHGHPHLFRAAVQNPNRLHAADLVWHHAR